MFTHTIHCPYCDNVISQNWSDYVVSSDIIDERGMGAEIEHEIECEEFECPECHQSFKVSGSVWEYPAGSYNHHELHTIK